MSLKRLTLAAAIAALPFSSHAADTELSTVIIKADKDQDVMSSRVDAASLPAQRAATSDTASLLRDVPGVSLYGAGGVSSLPAIHGLADDRLRIKVDGADMVASCPNHMNPPLSYVDPTNVARNQGLCRHHAGVRRRRFASAARSSSIRLTPPSPNRAGPRIARRSRRVLSQQRRCLGANFAATYATEHFSLDYAGATAESDNYSAGKDFKTYDFTGRPGHTLPRDEVGSTAYKTRNHTLGMAFKGGNHLFEATARLPGHALAGCTRTSAWTCSTTSSAV